MCLHKVAMAFFLDKLARHGKTGVFKLVAKDVERGSKEIGPNAHELNPNPQFKPFLLFSQLQLGWPISVDPVLAQVALQCNYNHCKHGCFVPEKVANEQGYILNHSQCKVKHH